MRHDGRVSAPTAPARPRRRTSVANLVLALGVVVALVAGLWLLVPRPTSIVPVAFDLPSAARAAEGKVGFPPAVVIPPGWTVTSAEVRTDSGGLPTWTVNYVTDGGRFVGLLQAPGWNADWQRSLTQGGTDQGAVTVAGRPWAQYLKAERNLTSLLLVTPDRTAPRRATLVLAKLGGVEEARVLAERVAAEAPTALGAAES